MKLFLDDIRQPHQCHTYMKSRIGNLVGLYLEDWKVVKNYDEFTEALHHNYRLISHVSFDHDLGKDIELTFRERGYSKRSARKMKQTERSGYDCAEYLKNFYKAKKLTLPVMFVHSLNPVGTQRIIDLFS